MGNDHEGLIKVVTGIDKDPEPGTAPSCGAPPQSRVTWRFLGKTGKGAVVRSMEVLGFVLAGVWVASQDQVFAFKVILGFKDAGLDSFLS